MKTRPNSAPRAKKPAKKRKYVFPVVIEKDEDGYFGVCPSLQGCYTQGDTIEEVMENLQEAVQLHVESRLEHGEDIPEYDIYRLTTVEVKPDGPAASNYRRPGDSYP